MARETGTDRPLASTLMPWLVAGASMLVYLLTLNRWVSLNNVSNVARLTGWTWQPEVFSPLLYVVTLPLRLLPETMVPYAANVLAALLASLTLALLARSVAILPHDRTQEQRDRETGPFAALARPTPWFPIMLAVVVCGLQLSFWEHATTLSGEILDVLVFAYVVRCLLEYRLHEEAKWLSRAVLVYALGITNNWGLIGFLPLFIVALIWLKKLEFFNTRFLVRMFALASAGLSLYLLLPLIVAVTGKMDLGFWQALKFNLAGQKSYLSYVLFNSQTLFKGDRPLWILGLPALLPLLIMAIRWPASFGDPSRLGVWLATWIFHFFHGVLLVLALWVALDPAISPRRMLPGVSLLTLYYLGALAVGYLAGYFLLVFGGQPLRNRPAAGLAGFVNVVMVGAIWALGVITPAALLSRNLRQIQFTNGSALRQYADQSLQAIPNRAVVVSDDPRRLVMAQMLAAQKRPTDGLMFLDTASLNWGDYHSFMAKKYPGRFTNSLPANTKSVEQVTILQTLLGLSQSNTVYYLHPSFGYFFEAFFAVPQGLVYRLERYATNTMMPEPMSDSVATYNETFWAKARERTLKPVIQAARTTATEDERQTLAWKAMQKAHLEIEPNRDAVVLAGFYSRGLTYWGVEQQKANQQKGNRLLAAFEHFQTALELNPENLVARMNLAFNETLLKKTAPSVTDAKFIEDQFGKYRSWDQVLNENGPFDEPTFTYEQGRTFVRGSLYRQAAQSFNRVAELVTNNLPARLWLAQLYVLANMPEPALLKVREIRQLAADRLSDTNRADLMLVESSAHMKLGQPVEAMAAITAALTRAPGDQNLLSVGTQVLLEHGQYTNALTLIERHLELTPDASLPLVNKGYAALQMGDYAMAIPPLTRAIELDSGNHGALLNRGIAYLRKGDLKEAKKDYDALQRLYPASYQVYYGLGDIAYQTKETNAALNYYQRYLANTATNTAEAEFVRKRMKELRPPRK
jgi:tetratricopeptide (TPR) repeat protein